jgi:hypothetical protein
MIGHLKRAEKNGEPWSKEEKSPAWANALSLVVWFFAAVVAFLPFALNTSPWDAVTLRVPGNQGNWWHVLVGFPFFLAYPMIWLRLRLFLNARLSAIESRIIWIATVCSIGGTVLVELPFLLHLAGTSAWQRLSILGLGFGILAVGVTVLLLRRRQISSTRAIRIGIETAYLANATLCLVVYSETAGTPSSRSGWLVSMVIVWPILFELIWLLILTLRAEGSQLASASNGLQIF